MTDSVEMEDVRDALEGSIEPREQQIFNVAAMMENPDQDFVNRQPVGTGKTEQAMMAMTAKALQKSERGEDYRGIVVLPSNSLVSQWENRFEKHGLDESGIFDVRRSKPKKSFSNWGTVSSMPEHMKDRKRQAIRQEDHEFKKHKALVYGSEALSSDWFTGSGKSGADVILTTHHMLKSDIENGRVDPENLEVDDVVIDEATAFVARNKEANKEGTFYGGHRVAKNFQDLVEGTYDEDTRYLALTALPGRKLEPIVDYLGAEIISPSEESLQVSMAQLEKETECVEPNRMVEDPFSLEEDQEEIPYTQSVLNSMIEEREDARENFRHVVVGNTDQQIQQDINVYGYVGHENDEIDERARRVLGIENNIQRVYEGGIAGFKEELPEGYIDPKMEKIDELASEFDSFEENYVIFASHKDTVERIGDITGAEVVTGDYSESRNNSILDDYGEDTDAVVMTYDYGAEGIDLPEGDHVVHMSDRVNPQTKLSATGRAKRGSDITEHTLEYSFEETSNRDAITYGRDVVPFSSQSTRNQIRKMLGQSGDQIHDVVQSRTMTGADKMFDHVLNTPPLNDR